MALSDFIKENKDLEIGKVTSDMDAEDVEMPERWWQDIAQYRSYTLAMNAHDMSERQTRFFISLLDNVIQDDIYGSNTSEEEREQARAARETIIEEM